MVHDSILKWQTEQETCNAVIYTVENQYRFGQSVERILHCTRQGGRVWFIGNGASATLGNHFSCDFLKGSSGLIPAFDLSNQALLTALVNDTPHSQQQWMVEAIRLVARPGDALIAISSSGTSLNVVRATEEFRLLSQIHEAEKRSVIITFSGRQPNNPLRQLGDHNFWVDSNTYNIIETVHGTMLGLLCDLLLEAVNQQDDHP